MKTIVYTRKTGYVLGMRYGDVVWKERQLSLSESEAGWFRMGNGKTTKSECKEESCRRFVKRNLESRDVMHGYTK